MDACLRRVLDALRPLEAHIEDAAAILGPTAVIAAAPRAWQRLRDAIADAEPWPLELLGPVIVTRAEFVDGKWVSKQTAAWFSRGHHPMERFQLFAKSEAKKQGLTLLSRPGMPTEQGYYAHWLPPDPAAGRVLWHPRPSDHLDELVPVTVWTPAA